MELIKYPKIRRLGHPDTQDIWDGHTVVTEKIDGANFRFGIDLITVHGNEIISRPLWGTRNVDYSNVPMQDWSHRFKNQWTWVLENKDKLVPGYVYFGEAIIPHSIQYDWDRFPAPIIGFDIWDTVEHRWVPYPENKKMFEAIGLPFVPVVAEFDGKPSVSEFEELIPTSKFYDGIAEGVVIKNYERGIFAKVVSKKFIEVNRSVFGRSKKEAHNDETVKWFEYLFPPKRIEKLIFKLTNEENKPLDMRLMRDLIYKVMQDASEEEGFELFRKAKAVDFARMRKMLSRRCQNVLQRLMAMRSLE